MKCLFCENPVSFVQSLVRRGVPFCCVGHQKAYHADTQRLMLARLMETRKYYRSARTNVFLAKQVQPPREPVDLVVYERRPEMRIFRMIAD